MHKNGARGWTETQKGKPNKDLKVHQKKYLKQDYKQVLQGNEDEIAKAIAKVQADYTRLRIKGINKLKAQHGQNMDSKVR